MRKVSIRFAGFLALGMALLFLDFFTKAYVFHFFPLASQEPFFPFGGVAIFKDFIGVDCAICLALNRGAAWGYFANFQIILLILRIAVVMGMLIYLLFINKKSSLQAPFALIITGAIGNIVDFFLYGYVVDFIHFNLWGYNFPVFNFADICISIGVVWLFFSSIIFKKKKQLEHE